ncbi:MAG TPA: TatD family hydrolase [Polyangia bacterium]|jgi:TatD DNase family protein
MESALIDIGANLTSKTFQRDLAAVIDRAAAAGVHTLVVTGTSLAGSRAAAALADQPARAALYATAGVHPHHAVEAAGDWLAQLRGLAGRARVVAVGECGLDFNRNYSPQADQLRCFRAQLELAAELGLPVFLHERDAHDAFVGILREHRASLRGAVVHCFTGTRAQLDAYLALDLHIGITGWICDERRGRDLVGLMPAIPAGRLMIETDAPYLLPRNMPSPPRDRRNEPAFLPLVLNAVAAARGEAPAATAAATTATARAFFALPDGRDL